MSGSLWHSIAHIPFSLGPAGINIIIFVTIGIYHTEFTRNFLINTLAQSST